MIQKGYNLLFGMCDVPAVLPLGFTTVKAKDYWVVAYSPKGDAFFIGPEEEGGYKLYRIIFVNGQMRLDTENAISIL